MIEQLVSYRNNKERYEANIILFNNILLHNYITNINHNAIGSDTADTSSNGSFERQEFNNTNNWNTNNQITTNEVLSIKGKF